VEQLKKYQAELKNPKKLAGMFQVSRPAMVIAVANFFGSTRNSSKPFVDESQFCMFRGTRESSLENICLKTR
jgi:hypothetical protein